MNPDKQFPRVKTWEEFAMEEFSRGLLRGFVLGAFFGLIGGITLAALLHG